MVDFIKESGISRGVYTSSMNDTQYENLIWKYRSDQISEIYIESANKVDFGLNKV